MQYKQAFLLGCGICRGGVVCMDLWDSVGVFTEWPCNIGGAELYV